MKSRESSIPRAKRSTAARKLTLKIAEAGRAAESARYRSQSAKADFKLARKRFKQAKKTAKRARKELKALKEALERATQPARKKPAAKTKRVTAPPPARPARGAPRPSGRTCAGR